MTASKIWDIAVERMYENDFPIIKALATLDDTLLEILIELKKQNE